MKAALAAAGIAALAAARPPLSFAPDVAAKLRRLPPTKIDYDRSLLDDRETAVLKELIEAARPLGEIFLRQVSPANPELRRRLTAAAARKEAGAPDALALFRVMAGPWDRLDGNAPFIGAEAKPPGAGFYPGDMTKAEFESWIAAHPGDKAAFEGTFTLIRATASR
jgi:hypothetical protein